MRNALGDVEANVTKEGIRCPLHVVGCASFVTQDVVETLVARDIRDDMRGDCLPLASEEYDRLARFLDEAHVAKAERFYCCHPTCGRLFAVPHRDVLARYGAGRAATPRAPPSPAPGGATHTPPRQRGVSCATAMCAAAASPSGGGA